MKRINKLYKGIIKLQLLAIAIALGCFIWAGFIVSHVYFPKLFNENSKEEDVVEIEIIKSLRENQELLKQGHLVLIQNGIHKSIAVLVLHDRTLSDYINQATSEKPIKLTAKIKILKNTELANALKNNAFRNHVYSDIYFEHYNGIDSWIFSIVLATVGGLCIFACFKVDNKFKLLKSKEDELALIEDVEGVFVGKNIEFVDDKLFVYSLNAQIIDLLKVKNYEIHFTQYRGAKTYLITFYLQDDTEQTISLGMSRKNVMKLDVYLSYKLFKKVDGIVYESID